MIILNALLHLVYFCAGLVAIFFASLAIGRFIEVKINRFKARRELRMRCEQSREWEVEPAFNFKLHRPTAEYVAPMGKTRVGIRGKS